MKIKKLYDPVIKELPMPNDGGIGVIYECSKCGNVITSAREACWICGRRHRFQKIVNGKFEV